MSEFSQPQTIAIIASSILSATLSYVGSMAIIVVLLRSQKKLTTTYRRIMFGMACMDITFSLTFCISDLPVPKGSPMVLNAIGNTATCDIQGFMQAVGFLGFSFYDAMLSIYFVLTIVYSVAEDTLQRKFEPFSHAFAILFPMMAGFVLIATKNFNSTGFVCWVAPLPLGCTNDINVDCERGESYMKYQWIFQLIPVLTSFVIINICMIHLVRNVNGQRSKMKKYGLNEIASNLRRKRRNVVVPVFDDSDETRRQAILYISAFFFTFIFQFLNLILRQIKGRPIFWIWLLGYMFLPLQGFFNFLIFIKPRVIKACKSHPEISLFQAYLIAVTSKERTVVSRRREMYRRASEAQITVMPGIQEQIDTEFPMIISENTSTTLEVEKDIEIDIEKILK